MDKDKINRSWAIHPNPVVSAEAVLRLEKALEKKQTEEIMEILQRPMFLRSVVVRKGEKGKNHDLLVNSFNWLVSEKIGQEKNIFNVTAEEIFDFLEKNKLPEQLLNEIMEIAYHKADKKLLYRIMELIEIGKEKWNDSETFFHALHTMASWKDAKENNPVEAIRLNKQVVEGARKIGSETLEKKALFGLTDQKDIKHKNKRQGFSNLSGEFGEKLNNKQDQIRADIEETRQNLQYAKLKSGKFKNEILLEAKNRALEILKRSIEMEYPRAEFLISKLLSEIYQTMGDMRKSESYAKRAEKLKEKYF